MKRSADGSWSDAAGNSLSLPITKAAANDTTNNKIRVYASGSANTQYPSVDVDSNGKPFISFGKEESGGVRKYCASWTGSSWNVRSVAFHSNNKETRTTLLHRGGDDFSLFGFGTNGRDLLEYKTTDGNTSWTFVKKVWSGVFDDPCVIWQSHNNAYLIFDDAAGTIRHGYLYGDAGFVGSNGITGGIVSTARWSLKANSNQRMSFIYLSGSARADVLRGSPKSEFLFGGAGEDKLVGRGGRDIVIGGTDDDKLFGNDGKDILQGGAGRDLLFGGAGKDKLNGGVGNDVLVGDFGDDRLNGGGGKDQFQYQTVQSFSKARFDQDTIADFTHGLDEIILGKGTFTALSSRTGKGFSHPHEFARVTRDIEAFTSGSLIVYNSETGKLFYNQNGIAAGLGNGGHFATLVGHPTLTASDFVLSAASNLF
jgi:Ca2+-binding RTX toxin-like protein